MAGFRWPPRFQLNWYNGRQKLLWTSDYRELDLEDSLPYFYPFLNSLIGMTVRSKTKKWSVWNEENVSYIQEWIREDICFDGHRMTMKRLSDLNIPCSEESRWRLRITHMGYDLPERDYIEFP